MSDFVLVTGGAGFLGTHVLRAALRLDQLAGARFISLDDLSGGFRENVPSDPRVTLVEGSVTDAALVDELFRNHRFRIVYHLAAYAAEGLSPFIRRFNYTNNLIGSVNLVNAAVKYEADCFVFTSSIAVYGEAQMPASEDTIPQPQDPYGIAKYAVELDLQAAHDLFGLDYVVFRPHNVYGEFQNIGDPYRNVVGIFMNRLIQGQPMPIFGDGEQRRAFTYVADVAPLMARSPLVPAARNQVFNVGAEHAITVNDLAERVAIAMNVPCRVEYHPARHEAVAAFADHTKAQRVFGEQSETSLQEGLARMAAWVKQAGARPGKPFGALEISRNLPSVWRAFVDS